MNDTSRKRIIWQRVLYTLCFFALCIIDWVKGSLNGRAQMTATNISGIVILIIILGAINTRDFLKPIYAIWTLLCAFLVPIGIITALNFVPYKGQVVTASLNIALYGYILMRIITGFTKKKKIVGIRIPLFIGWLFMLVLMLISVNENIWPAWYVLVFGGYYLTEFDSETQQNIYKSIVDGIIIGFIAIQGMALLFRPYDVVRYLGLYVNPNMNALFYLMTYSAMLCKWFLLKKENNYTFLRVIICLLAGSIYGFTLFTGSKTAILAMLIVTIPCSLLSLRYFKKRVISYIGYWIILGAIGILSVPIVYCAIRYMPTIHLHPLYFEGEYSESRILPGEPRGSEKYVSFDAAMESNVGRVFYKLPMFNNSVVSPFAIRAHAAELEDYAEPQYIFSSEESVADINPIKLRYEIHKYYFERLNLVGHTNDYEPAPVHYMYTAPHAHNVFIQMGFLYGIPAGIMFVLMVISFIPACIELLRSGNDFRVCVISCFVLAFVAFGFFEIDWMCGQLPFTLFFLLFRDAVRKKTCQSHSVWIY